MASKGTSNSDEKIPQIDQVSSYTIPAEEKCTGAKSKTEKACIRKSKQKSFSDEIKAENLEGHKNFDNIEDILTFINGKKIENEKDDRKRETEHSLGAIRKSYSVKDKYSGLNTSKVKKDEKEKSNVILPIEKLFEGLFLKNHDSVEKPTKIIEDKDEQITSESIVSNNVKSKKGYEKTYDQFEWKNIVDSEGAEKRNYEDIEITEAVANVKKETVLETWVEISSKLVELVYQVSVALESEKVTLNDKLKVVQAALDQITTTEKNIETLLLEIGANQNEKVSQILKLKCEAKKGLKVLENEIKLKQEVIELTRKRFELNKDRTFLSEELRKYDENLMASKKSNKEMQEAFESTTKDLELKVELEQISPDDALEKFNEEFDKYKVNCLAADNFLKNGEKLISSTREIMSNLKQKVKETDNEVTVRRKQINILEEEKESQNEVLRDALKKVEDFEAKSESPRNDCLAIEIKPHMEDEKPETLRDPSSLPRESTYELTFHKTSLTTFKTSGKEDLSSILKNCSLVLAGTNWSIQEWGINTEHPDCHKQLDEENQRRRCNKDISVKYNLNMKGCGLDLVNCDHCELVTKSIAYHEEYKRIVEIVDQGGRGRPIKRQAEGLAKDAMRSFLNVLIPFLVNFINGEATYFLEYQEDLPVELWGAEKLKDVWERLLYVKFPLQRIRIDQDYLVVLQQKADNLKEANLEYEDVLDLARSYVSSRKELVELLDEMPSFSAWFQKAEKDLDSWSNCAGEFVNLANEVFSMLDSAKESSKTGSKVEVVDLKCVEEFLYSAINFTKAAKSSVSKKVPLGMMQKMDWAKELLKKIHCDQCRKVILVPGKDLVNLEKCSVCKAVRYCNATCQELQWQDHKEKCAQMKKMEKKRKRKESRTGRKVIQEKEKFWEKMLKPFLCRPGVRVETLEPFLYSSLH